MTDDLLIHNGTILTVNPRNDVVQNGFVYARAGQIVEVGPEASLRAEHKRAETVIDAKRRVVLPGLISSHTHIALTLLRGYCDGFTLDGLVANRLWPFEKQMRPEDTYNAARYGCLEFARAGITCFADMHFNMEQVARAVLESGLRASLCVAMMDIVGPGSIRDSTEENERLVRQWHKKASGRITCMYGPCTIRTASKQLFVKARELADRDGVGCHIHLSEVEADVKFARRKYRRRPALLLRELGFLRPDVIAAHCVWLDDKETRVIGRTEVNVAHNPISNARLGVGVAPIVNLLKNGANMGVGLDAPIFNLGMDMFEELRTAAMIQMINNPKAISDLTAETLLRMATINNARALQLEHQVGSLEVGKKADLIIVEAGDGARLGIPDKRSVTSELVYGASSRDVQTTIVDGKVLMIERKLLDVNEAKIAVKAKDTARQVLSRSGILKDLESQA